MRLQLPARQGKDAAADRAVTVADVTRALRAQLGGVLSASLAQQLFWLAEALLLGGAVTAATLLSRAEEWQPLVLVGMLLVLALGGDWLSIEIRIGQLSASMVALVLAMSLLGPAPAVAFGLAAITLTSAIRRLRASQWLNNLAMFAVVPLLGGLMVRALAGDVHSPHDQHLTHSVTFGLIVMGMFMAMVILNFLLFALDHQFAGGRSAIRQTRETFFPMLPGQLATGAIATILVVAYTNSGLPVLFASVFAVLIFRHLTVALLRSEDRADQLEARTIHLVSLQLGVLRTLVRALSMRDETTGRHAAAVARYARELAKEVGAGEDEQDTVHTAGLLHDIGKFTWPDQVLHAEVVGQEDQAIVRRHPQDGAELVGALDGYGPVADTILYHHERVDGSGYPAGLIGKEIPLGSRILAICCTYDTMTQRGSYRPPMSPAEAMGELRIAAERGQLDRELVETFIGMLEREGPTFGHRESTDFDTELAFGRRVREMASPSGRHDKA
ncbi:MAG TPA: HD domain-containing phosphohydrolase [Solirubrobacteraceae bacterium]|nr:HD domain-containing phosphohydrolase [Solirubrobacteraceae bacterium]